MDIKSVGLLRSGPAIEDEREKAAEKLRSNSSFKRATPPQAGQSSNPEDLEGSVIRMADFIKKFAGKKRPGSKKKKPISKIQKAIATYSSVSQGDNPELSKGLQFSKLI